MNTNSGTSGRNRPAFARNRLARAANDSAQRECTVILIGVRLRESLDDLAPKGVAEEEATRRFSIPVGEQTA